MINIAEWSRALLYFCVFGIISVLIDLDHVIKVYEVGLEINIENMWQNGTRALHIPILILSGCLFIAVFTLFIRFWVLNIRSKNVSPNSGTLLKSIDIQEPEIIYIKCPKCKSLMGVIAPADVTTFPCVNCGIMGSLSSRESKPIATFG